MAVTARQGETALEEIVTVKIVVRQGVDEDMALYVAPGAWRNDQARSGGVKLTESEALPVLEALHSRQFLARNWAHSGLAYRR